LALHFSPFDLTKFDRNGPPLEVALVNAKSQSKPTKAEILAQAHLDGGGNTDAERRAKTPLPVVPKEGASSDLATAAQKVDDLEKRAKEMLTQLQAAQTVALPAPKPNDSVEAPELPSASEMMRRTLEAMRLEVQIAKRMGGYAKRPKRRFVRPRAEDSRCGRYERHSLRQ